MTTIHVSVFLLVVSRYKKGKVLLQCRWFGSMTSCLTCWSLCGRQVYMLDGDTIHSEHASNLHKHLRECTKTSPDVSELRLRGGCPDLISASL